MGRGSATLNRVLMHNKLQRNKWTERDLLKAAQDMGAGTGPTKTLSWTKVVKQLVPLRQVGELEGMVAHSHGGRAAFRVLVLLRQGQQHSSL